MPAPSLPTAVLFLHEGEDWVRGSERCLIDLAAGLDLRRFVPVVLCTAPRLAAALRARDVAVELVPASFAPDEGLLPSRAARERVADAVQRYGARIVHANTEHAVAAALAVTRAHRVPLVIHLHMPATPDERLYGWLHQADRIVGVSRDVLGGFVRDGTDAARLRLIHNGVDARRLDAGDARDLRHRLGIPPDAFVATAVCSLIPRKGVDVVVRAVARLGREPRPYHLLVVGDGSERAALTALARREGVANRVHFLGERDDVGAVLRDASDVAVSGSRAETFGLNLIEAAFHGLAAVATDIPPHREAAPPDQAALLVPPDDAEALAAALRRLGDDAELRARLGTWARDRVRAEFTVERYVADFEALYEELLASPAARFGWRRGGAWPRAYWRWIGGALRRRLGGRRAGPTAGGDNAPTSAGR